MEKKKINKSIIAVSVSLAIVLVIMILLFVLGQEDDNKSAILLPETQSESTSAVVDHTSTQDSVLQIDKDNVLSALASVELPKYYRQSYTVEVGSGSDIAKSTVELWVNDSLKYAQIANERMTKFVMTNGSSAWIWYSHDTNPINVSLQSDITFEDLLGLPGFDYLQMLKEQQITASEYLLLEDGQTEVACIFLDVQEEYGAISRYWINLKNGLLYRADCVENDTPIYRIDQVSCDLLVNEDEAFAGVFVLPDGSLLTTEGTQMQ